MEEQQKKSLEIKIDPAVAQGRYSNFAVITHSDSSVILDFVFVDPQAPRGQVVSRIITSPQHAKRLLAALADNIGKYEAQYGPIVLREGTEHPKEGMNYLH